jgi:hypothetical protein
MRRRREHRRRFGGRWQERVPLRFPDPRHGETLGGYCKRIGYAYGELAALCWMSGGDRVWSDGDDLRAWFMEIGYTSPFFHWNGVKQTGDLRRHIETAERTLVTFKDF